MAASDYHFITRWRVEGSVEEVSDVLNQPAELPRWWPSVYLDVTPGPTFRWAIRT